MSEPDDDTVRRWQEYTRTPGAGPAGPGPTGPPVQPEPPRTPPPPPAFSARRMAAAGLALFAVLAVLAVLITWPSDPPTSSATRRPGQTVGVPQGSKAINLVAPQQDTRVNGGTVIKGVPWLEGHEPNHMIDGELSTMWEMRGSGAGREIRFNLGAVHRITRVAIALPTSEARPISRVTWTLPDASRVVTQDLASGTGSLQTLDIAPGRSSVVTLTLETVGSAPAVAADVTGISEIAIVGF